MALCITRADTHDDKWRSSIQEQLKPILDEYDLKILFLGCVIPSDCYNYEHLLNAYADVYKLRSKMLNFILESEYQQKLLDLDLMTVKKDKMQETMTAMPIV